MTSGRSGFVENTGSAAVKAFGRTFLGSSSTRGVFYSSRNSGFFQWPPSPGGTPALRRACQTLQKTAAALGKNNHTCVCEEEGGASADLGLRSNRKRRVTAS